MVDTLLRDAPTTTTAPTTKKRNTARSTAGALLAVAGAGILLSIITAEALYPAPYFTDENTISDLGEAACRRTASCCSPRPRSSTSR